MAEVKNSPFKMLAKLNAGEITTEEFLDSAFDSHLESDAEEDHDVAMWNLAEKIINGDSIVLDKNEAMVVMAEWALSLWERVPEGE